MWRRGADRRPQHERPGLAQVFNSEPQRDEQLSGEAPRSCWSCARPGDRGRYHCTRGTRNSTREEETSSELIKRRVSVSRHGHCPTWQPLLAALGAALHQASRGPRHSARTDFSVAQRAVEDIVDQHVRRLDAERAHGPTGHHGRRSDVRGMLKMLQSGHLDRLDCSWITESRAVPRRN